jgi:hypothetical protein
MTIKHVAIITASFEALDPPSDDTLQRFEFTVLETTPPHTMQVTSIDESEAIRVVRTRIASVLSGQLVRIQVVVNPPAAVDPVKAFAEASSHLGDESVIPLDEVEPSSPAAPTIPVTSNDNEAGTPE